MLAEVPRPTALERLRGAFQALEVATASVPDAKHLRDLAEAARVYARQAQLGLEAQNYAAEVKLRAERRVGELLPLTITRGGDPKLHDATLADVGINKFQSHRWQALAALPEAEFEAYLSQARETQQEITSAAALRLAEQYLKSPRPIPEPGSSEANSSPLLRYCPPGMPAATIVAAILRVAFPDAETALDPTYGNGAFWNGSAHVRVTGVDVDADRAPDGVADFRRLPYPDSSYDVVLFDPPHLADSGAESIMGSRFGTYTSAELGGVVRDGCAEAWRVARLGVVVKATDGVHNQRFIAMTEWVREAISAPLYEVVHETRASPLVDPRWGEQLSAYNNGATFQVFRKDGPLHARRPLANHHPTPTAGGRHA